MPTYRPIPGILACLSAFHAYADDFSAWSRHADLALNTAAVAVTETVTGFPLLVRLDATHFDFSAALPSGADLRFAKPDGTPLPHEIESWNSQARTAAVWVRLDTLRGGASDQSIRMHWGNPAASDISNANAVYPASDGLVGVWHLGGGAGTARPNAVPGGNPAVPGNYDGDETAPGVVGGSDSLDGDGAGDYLDLGMGYSDFSAGFSFSAWIRPTAVKNWGRILDLGNGQAMDNIIVTRVLAGDGIGFHNFQGADRAVVETFGQLDDNEWQHFSVTVSGNIVRIYKNGSQVLERELSNALSVGTRTLCFLGRSNWAADEFFQGNIDEAVLARTARSDAWMRLQWLNQKPAQELPTYPSIPCTPSIALPADTTVDEGQLLALAPMAPCASGFTWSIESGPAPRILDPEADRLSLLAPRVAGDTVVAYRVVAAFPDSSRTRVVRVMIREAIPEPDFAMPADRVWNGRDPIEYAPAIANLAALEATGNLIRWAWSFTGAAAETTVLPSGVRLVSAEEGLVNVRLCLDNGGPQVCREGRITVLATSSLARRPGAARPALRPGKDALGRSGKARAGGRRFSTVPGPAGGRQ